MSKPAAEKKDPIVWRRPDGSVVACVEKVKVLNENHDELRTMMQDLLDDALLMGCSEAQVRQVLQHMLDELQASVAERPDAV